MRDHVWPGSSIWAAGREFRYQTSSNSFVEFNENKQEGYNMSNRKQWSFHTLAPDYQIDFKEIRKDLSPSHPIALVEVEGEKEWRGYVLIHDSILDKASLLKDVHDFTEAHMNEYLIAYEPSDFDYWTEWVTEIKNAKWPEEVKNKAIVKVTLKRV